MLVAKSINLFRFLHFIEMLSKSLFKLTFSLANILHIATFFTTCKNITSVESRKAPSAFF